MPAGAEGVGLSLTSVNAGLEIGSVVAGKFRLERILAEGGMGLVAAATHLQLDQTVALKFFRGDVVTTNESRLRFMREAKAAAQLKSEYVARVLDVGVTDSGAPYIVMEYLDGQGLERVIANDKSLTPSSACEYAIQACEALSEAHARGIIHRDIKPSNLFVVERAPGWRAIKVLDFGVSKMSLAQASNITTNLNVVMGTPCYMSPEQIQSAAGVDHRTDIWSLGATLYQMLTGCPPFDPALPILALAEDIAGKEIRPVSELCPEVPAALSAVVARCLERDRDRRIASAADLAAALVPFAPARAHLVAERAATIAMVLSASPRSVTPVTPVPSGGSEIDDASALDRRREDPGPLTPPAPTRPDLRAATEAVTPRAGESLASLAVAETQTASASGLPPAPASASAGVGAGASTGDGAGSQNVGDLDLPVFVDAPTTDSVSRPIGFASPTTPPYPIAWSELDGQPPSVPGSRGQPGSPTSWEVSTGRLPPDRDAAREQSWQAWVEGWLTPKAIATLATGSITLCVFAFLILPRLVHKPTLVLARSVQGAESPSPELSAVGAAAPSAANALVVYVAPPNAQIVVDGVLVHGNPYRAQFPHGGIHLVKAYAPGYEPRVEQAHMSGDVVINLSLERSGRFTNARPASGRPSRSRPAPGAPPRVVAGGGTIAPAASAASLVDPHGGRAPLHPIVTTSPYDSQ